MGKNEARTHRCTHCDKDWPYITEYTSCPICGTDTYTTTTNDILTLSAAKNEIANAEAAIQRRLAIEQRLDAVIIEKALATLDEELGSLLC